MAIFHVTTQPNGSFLYGELFPHIFGAIDPAAVLDVHPAAFDATRTFRWPAR